jgi:hypothetical protein
VYQLASSSYKKPIVAVILGSRFYNTTGVRGLAEANKKAGTTLYFFGYKDVDYKRKEIKGTYYDQQKKVWKIKKFPLPDVLYVRGGTGSEITRAVERFDKMGIKRINSLTGFNKGELFSKLIEDKNVRPYLPYTTTIEDLDKARAYIRKLGKVYIKACRGRRGTQVMRVVKVKHKGYEYSYSIIGDLVRNKARNFKAMQKVMDKFFGDRKVIVQQAIDLVKVDHNRSVDFRAELQRNKYGGIEIVAVPIRVGQRNSPITTHGAAYKLDDYLPKLFPKYSRDQIKELKNKIDDFLIAVYKGVEKVYGKFGEIGIDFGVDKSGKIRLIECNAQSAKVSIRKAYGSRTAMKIYLNPLEYAKRIANRR